MGSPPVIILMKDAFDVPLREERHALLRKAVLQLPVQKQTQLRVEAAMRLMIFSNKFHYAIVWRGCEASCCSVRGCCTSSFLYCSVFALAATYYPTAH